MTAAFVLIGAYLAGSIPFGYLVARVVMRDDIRRHGSGNIGATNIARVLGTRWGLFVLVLDCTKGVLPTLLLPDFVVASGGDWFQHLRVAVGIATVIGHMFPVWLSFRGGKGVATALGVVIVLGPTAVAFALVAFLIVGMLTRYVALASMTAAITFAIVRVVQLGPRAMHTENLSLSAFCILVPALIIIRHRSNLSRMLQGTEPKFRSDKNQL